MLKVSGLQLNHLTKSENSDQVRKLLKHVSDTLRKIEEKHQTADKVEDVFSLELMSLRTRMKDLLLKIFPLDPLKSGSKVLEYFWRKCYHEPFSVAKQLRGSGWTKYQAALVQSHLLSGVGTYHHIILFLVKNFGWSNSFRLDFSPSAGYGWSAGLERKPRVDPESLRVEQRWVESQVVRCLVWCGDLSRYAESELRAERYYFLSCRLAPNSGQAYNNLAMCSADRNHGLDQLYFYLRCVNCKVGAENGENNLARLLDKGVQTGAPGADLVAGMTQLVRSVTRGDSQDKMTVSCQQSLHCLHACLLSPNLDLAPTWLSLTVSSVILLVQHKSEPLCQAWLLAIFSHLTGKLSKDVLAEYPELELREPEKNVEEEKEMKDEVNKRRKNKLEGLLRRRRTGQSGSEGEDSEESSDETFESEEEVDEEADDEDNDSDDFYLESSSEEDEDDDVVVEEKIIVPSQSDVVSLSNRGEILQTILLCQSWLQSHHQILAQTGSGSEQLWENLATFFNILSLSPRDNLTESPELSKLLTAQEKSEKLTPLPEDWLLRGVFKDSDSKFDWDSQFYNELEEKVSRLRRVSDFRTWLCAREESKITWDEERQTTKFRKDIVETDKKNVMKHMAELWLRQEVNNLENAEKEGGGIVVVDCSALVTNLPMVKRTLGLKKVTVVVPSVAVIQLDGLKKSERGAREAIRWLERELGRGSRWLRAQKQEESLELQSQTEALSKHQLQLLQCLEFFIACNGPKDVTLLTGNKDILDGGAEILGETRDKLNVENIEGFVPRFLGISDQNGKLKRRSGRGKRRRDLENIG